MFKVAVIGGGISGLAAALHLAEQPHVEMRLYESAGRLGGVLESVCDGDYLIERSADNFATLIPDARELSERYGLLPSLIHPNADGRQAFIYKNGSVYPIPAGFSLMQPTRIWSILSTPILSWHGKLRLLSEYWIPPRPANMSGQFDDESLQSFASRRLGKEAFDCLVEPIISGIFTADPQSLSMAATMPQFWEMERSSGGLIRGYLRAKRADSTAAARRASGARYDQFMAPREGMSAWIEGLARHLPENCVRLNCPVTELTTVTSPSLTSSTGASGWQLKTSDGQSLIFDGVILATPASVTARLLHTVAPVAAELVGGIPYASSAVVAMVVNRADIAARVDGFGLVIPSNQHRTALAISYSSNKYPGRVPDDQMLLRVFLGGALRPEIMAQTDRELLSMATTELREILGWRGTQARWQAVIRWPHAMPQYNVGHLARLEQIHQQLAALPTLRLCGAAYQGVGIPQCVRSAQQAANELLGALQLN
ncbi:MAG: protoporphyrinogen oxidase [Pirellulaceae bacterium]|nr:protoporphyrinogen oxidase [Pirellulaceae bacterium]